jgi:hypothetical protein
MVPVRAPKRPATGLAKVRVDDAGVARQILGCRRLTMLGEIVLCSDEDDTDVAELSSDEAGVGRAPHAHGHVETFVHQVRDPVGEADLELDLRIAPRNVEGARVPRFRRSWGGEMYGRVVCSDVS